MIRRNLLVGLGVLGWGYVGLVGIDRAVAAQAGGAGAQAGVAMEKPAARVMEKLGRGVIVMRPEAGKAFVSWRLLGTESPGLGFDVYRATDGGAAVKLNAEPLTGATHFVDATADFAKKNVYSVRPVGSGASAGPVGEFALPAGSEVRPYFAVKVKQIEGYTPNDATVADLDGDGEYEIVIKMEGRGKDNSQAGLTDPVFLHAYKLDGTLLWEINLGKNIRGGAHYTQLMVYDLDGDGRAEVVCKTADGTVDGTGKVIGDGAKDWRNPGGYVLDGPELLTVFDGRTGAALDTATYDPARVEGVEHPTGDQMKAVWGDGYGNRMDRFLACVAYLDGVNASVVFSRGYYTRSVLAAWDFRGGKLVKRWTFDSSKGPESNRAFAGQGNHNLSVADVDGDGKDEIIFGGMVVNSDGTGRVSTGLGHGDAIHASVLDPERGGILVARIQERVDDAGLHVFDANTGEVIWRKPTTEPDAKKKQGPGRGVAFDIDPRHPGAEVWCGLGGGIEGLYDIRGNEIVDLRSVDPKKRPPVNMAVWWDGDDLREMLDATRISKWDWEHNENNRVMDAAQFGCASNNGTKANPCLVADLFGDWREEIIWRSEDNSELRIFSTTIPTTRRMYTLMHDPVYRMSVAWQNVAYNQPTQVGFFLGHGMKEPPRPNIVTGK